jgi:hypothetical protein
MLGWGAITGKESSMQTIRKLEWVDLGSWPAAFASLLPLWLFSLAASAEGFPRPPISAGWGTVLFYLGLGLSILLLWKGWLTVDLLLYSLFPLFLLFYFDEISTSYKTPFLLLSALLLTAGILGYQRSLSHSLGLAWLVLLLSVVATWIFASHAVTSYWQMVGTLHFPAGCSMPYARDCPLLSGHEIPAWELFFSL